MHDGGTIVPVIFRSTESAAKAPHEAAASMQARRVFFETIFMICVFR